MTKSVRPRLLALPALLGSLALAACGDATGPTGPFDPEATADVMQSMVAATAGVEEAFAGMQLAAPALGTTTAADLLRGGEVVVLPDVGTSLRVAESAAFTPFFPSNFLGVTFVWDEASGSYVASDGSDAPADGVRIVYYAIDPFTGEPASPLNPLGYVELRDLSTASSSRLGVLVKRTAGGEATLADYYIDLSYTTTQDQLALRLESVGFLSNGTDQLNFDLTQDVVVTDSAIVLTQDFGIDLEGTDIGVRYEGELTAGLDGETAALDLTATIENGADRVVLALNADAGVLTGSVAHNGATVALIGGTPAAPEFTDPDGNPLSEEDRADLQAVWESVNTLFELVEGIFAPAGG